MEWYALVLILSLSSSIQADCTSQCLKCAQEIFNTDEPISSLTCTLECEATLLNSDELEKCGKILQARAVDLTEFSEDNTGARSAPEGEEEEVANKVKRYGGFIKRIDKNKNKIFTSPWRENAVFKGAFPKKYEDLLEKFAERDLSEFSEDDQGGSVASENEKGVYNDDAAINEVKRYGGFLRKFGPKRSNSMEEGRQVELQKRYGGFMRRIRPKLNNLKWDNQKRYGGFLRRHFKISVRSDEEPSSYDDLGL
ncbi:proenkephalin-B [Osmerus eperlanus]|uniref:proenkephalin-B n=1 Tax=Osmerus eperlanus TaxID=29151 RepID=UPI002E0D1BAF